MMNMNLNRVSNIFSNIKGQKVAVVGDVMLDRYFWGNVSRVSPEAPVPVVDIESETFHLGGAANVAKNLCSLKITPILCGLLGNDEPAEIFINQCNKCGILADGLFVENERVTTVKTRVIGNNQQIVRLDREVRCIISKEGENFILNKVKSIEGLAGIIFEDYDKGTISDTLIKNITNFANKNNIPVFVDPKFDNFNKYKNVTLFKPNKKETMQGLGIQLNSYEDIKYAGNKLLEKLKAEYILITLGSAGMVLFEKNGDITKIPTVAKKIADVSGAGDTAIATFATMLISGATCKEAAILANFASGYVCEKPGIVAINQEQLLKAASIMKI